MVFAAYLEGHQVLGYFRSRFQMVSNTLNNVCLCGSGGRGAPRNYYTDRSKPMHFAFICAKLGVEKPLVSFVSSGRNNLLRESLVTISISYFTQQHFTKPLALVWATIVSITRALVFWWDLLFAVWHSMGRKLLPCNSCHAIKGKILTAPYALLYIR